MGIVVQEENVGIHTLKGESMSGYSSGCDESGRSVLDGALKAVHRQTVGHA